MARSKQGIYLLSANNTKKPIKAKKILTKVDDNSGSYRLKGLFSQSIADQYAVSLEVIKNKVVPHKIDILKSLGFSIDLGKNSFDGPSIGLSLFLSMVGSLVNVHPFFPLGATGVLDKFGGVNKISHLKSKLDQALLSNIGIVMIPSDNLVEYQKLVNDDPKYDKLKIIPVRDVIQAMSALLNISKYGIVDEII